MTFFIQTGHSVLGAIFQIFRDYFIRQSQCVFITSFLNGILSHSQFSQKKMNEETCWIFYQKHLSNLKKKQQFQICKNKMYNRNIKNINFDENKKNVLSSRKGLNYWRKNRIKKVKEGQDVARPIAEKRGGLC